MKNKNLFTQILAWIGTILVWLPILAPIFFSLAFFIRRHVLQIDYLMPAEFFPVPLGGGVLLLIVALLWRKRRGLIGGSLGAAAVFLAGALVLAEVTGLASGSIEPNGGPWLLVIGSLILYILALVVLGFGGVLLLRDRLLPNAQGFH